MNFKKTLAIIMSATMVFSPAVSVYAYDTETDNGAIEMYEPAKAQASSGTCGEKLTWTLDGNGKLTISGKGAIYDGAFSSMYDFEDSSVIRSVVIGTGVTGIGASAFEYCSSLESVTIPSSVTYIADYAFYECSSLKSITIPASVSSIGDDVFSMCSTLTEIKVNANNNYYSSDETGALFDKNKTVLIQYPVGNSSASYDFPAGVKSINAWAFSYCSNIESVTFSDALTSIGDYAFYECSGLKSVVIPGNVQKIGDSAFEYCPSLSSVSISDSVTSIGYGAFYNCAGLLKISVGANNKKFSSDEYGVLFDKNKTTIIQYPTGNERSTYTFPVSVTEVSDSAFSGCYSITDIFYGGSSDDWADIMFGSGNDLIRSANVHYGQESCPHEYGDWIIDIVFSSCETGGKKHKECTLCGDVIIEEKPAVTHNFGEWTANSAGKYERVCSACSHKQVRDFSVVSSGTCGDLLTWTLDVEGTLVISGRGKINEGAFSNIYDFTESSSIRKVVIESGVTGIGVNAFYDCTDLSSVTIASGVASIGSGAFKSCSSLTSIVIPDGVTSISDGTFNGCSSLKSVTIPESVTSIGASAFYDCSSLVSVTIPSNTVSIDESAFSYCSALTSVSIPASVTSIGKWAFYNCSILTGITVDENNAYYSSDVNGVLFNKSKTELIQYPAGNTRTSYTIPNTVKNVSDSAFQYCSNLSSVIISNGVVSIGNDAFEYCTSLTSVTVPDSVSSIGDNAFVGCSNIVSFDIGSGVANIGDGVFTGCSAVTEIAVDPNNKYYSNDNYGVLFNKNKTILIQYPVGNERTSYTVPEGVTDIYERAFRYSSYLESVTVSDSVVNIGAGVFEYCSSLSYVKIGSSVASIGDSAFIDCPVLNEIKVDGNNAYYSSDEYGALFNKNKTSLIQYPIGNERKSYTVPAGVTNIGICAFQYCTSLSSVYIPASVEVIYDFAFWGCSGITEVIYSATEEQWSRVSVNMGNDAILSAAFTYGKDGITKVGIKFLSPILKDVYTYGEDLSFDGAVVVVMYSDGTHTVIEDYAVSGYDKFTFGTQSVTLTYSGFSCEFEVSVIPISPVSATDPVEEGTTVDELLAIYSSYTVYVFDKDKTTLLSGNTELRSGYVVQLLADGVAVDSLIVNVAGDLTGDGVVNTKDLIRLKKHIFYDDAVEHFKIADINRDGTVDEQDIQAITAIL